VKSDFVSVAVPPERVAVAKGVEGDAWSKNSTVPVGAGPIAPGGFAVTVAVRVAGLPYVVDTSVVLKVVIEAAPDNMVRGSKGSKTSVRRTSDCRERFLDDCTRPTRRS
jgi:hypothetical protein